MAIVAETERLLIREWQPDDVAGLCALTREAGIGEFSISGYENFDESRALGWISLENQRFQRFGLGKFAVILKSSGEFIGISGLFQMPEPLADQIEINYRYPIRFRGQGFALEAAKTLVAHGFRALKYPKVHAIIEPANEPSAKIARRLGMTKAGQTSYLGHIADLWSLSNPHQSDQ